MGHGDIGGSREVGGVDDPNSPDFVDF